MESTFVRIGPQTRYLLDSAQIRDTQVAAAAAKHLGESPGQRWCCAICKIYITDDSQRICIDGEYDHYKINPQGQAFRFRSFRLAQGCVRVGQATAEHSWYTNYTWQFAYCAQCHRQLGWYFTGPQPFYGLINQQLIRCSEAKSNE